MRKSIPKEFSAKTTKVQLLLRPTQKAVLTRAAMLSRTTISDFIVQHAYEAAQQILAENVDLIMSAAGWKVFCQALDAPPRVIPPLKKLLNEASVFDRQRQRK
jgi:uncharacterized protein (DUF1778 family)